MRKTGSLKRQLRAIYRKNRVQDREVGLKINDLTQALHLQFRLPEKERDVKLMATCIQNLSDARKERRFRDDFPSFPKFYNYIVDPKNKFTLEDIKDL